MLVHLVTLCVGLVIAFGLQQLVALYLRSRIVRRDRAVELARFLAAAQSPRRPPADGVQ